MIARWVARFIYKVVNEIAAMEIDEPEGEGVVLSKGEISPPVTEAFGFMPVDARLRSRDA